MPVVRVVDVWKSFGATVALRGVSLDIAEASIHGLVGRNGAGKSTLVSIVTGITQPDRGSIEFLPAVADQQSQTGRTPCATVYQQSQLFPYLSVAENLFLQATGPSLVDWSEWNQQGRTLLREWNLRIAATRVVRSLRADERQLVEIARAFAAQARIIILDEPTAALQGARERQVLFSHIKRLRDEAQVTFLFISHYLNEVFELCDHVTVLRDGAVVATRPVPEMTEDAVVHAMVGSATGAEEVERQRDNSTAADRTVILSATDVFADRSGTAGSSWKIDLRKGEALGFAGAAGSGAIACAETLAGFRSAKRGLIQVGGREIPNGRPDKAIEAGIVMVAADRHSAGVFPNLTVLRNISISALDRLSVAGLVSANVERALGSRLLRELSIVASSTEQPITSLSGGNQQKTMFARALAVEPQVLILCNPTVGVDVASKAAIYGVMKDLLKQGISLIIATEDELKDVQICGRVIVFKDGAPVRELNDRRTDEELLAAVEGLD